jgi:hypothetical protein
MVRRGKSERSAVEGHYGTPEGSRPTGIPIADDAFRESVDVDHTFHE